MGWPTSEFRWIVRRLSRAPLFTAITLLTLAVGIGANTAIFSVVNGVLLKPLPYADPDRLVAVWHAAPGIGIQELPGSPSTYFTYRELGQSFEHVGVYRQEAVNLTGLAEPERLESLTVTDAILPALGIEPMLGRRFTLQDDQPNQARTVMLTHGLWQRKFGGDPNVVGQSIRIDGEAHQVIGVLPASFRFLNAQPALLVPFRLNPKYAFVGQFGFPTLAKLKPGVTIEQANTDVARMLKLLPERYRMAPGMSLKMIEEARIGPNLRALKEEVIGDIGKVLWVLMATIGIVLFIACANVANLLLVRVEGRQREIAVRTALGASRWQIAREMLLESAVLGLTGGALGVGVAAGCIALLQSLAPASLPRLHEITLAPSVLLFTAILSLVAGLLFGLIPVLKCAGPHLEHGLHSGGRTMSEGRERHRARGALVVLQVALALVLLIGAGLMIRTMQALYRVDPGFAQPGQLMTVRISIPDAFVKEPAQIPRLQQEIANRFAAIPGVQSVGLANSVPMDGNQSNDPVFAESKSYRDGEIPPMRRYKFVGPNYFQTMGNSIKAGRDLTWDDIHNTRPVVQVSENLAIELWGSAAAAVGKRVRENPQGIWREVVGVTGDERDNGADRPAASIIYLPLAVKGLWGDTFDVRTSLTFVLRTPRAGTAALLNDIRQQVQAVNPDLPLANPRTMQVIYERSLARTAFTLTMLTIGAGMALFLGLIGIYGVLSYAVTQRTREIGIRLALGAPRSSVQGLFLRYGLTLTGLGVLCGIAAAVPVSSVLSSLLFEVSPADPVTYAAVAALLLAAAAVAAYLPARRATAIDPMSSLRAD
jgi:putative ABC transport system permease protein